MDSFDEYRNCSLCPRNCGVDRISLQKGICGATSKLVLARAALHMWEEPCISGKSGSGTVFFSGCQLGCVFCQNKKIANMQVAKTISVERLCDIFFELEQKGANNINLVSGDHFVPHIVYAIELAKQKRISIPFLYNCSGYQKVQTLKKLDGLIDIYLPDFKYMSPKFSKMYSFASDYAEYCKPAIAEMYHQTGKNKFFINKNGERLLKKGIVVRHLVLPNLTGDSKRVLRYLYNTYSDNIYISIMSQYTPQPQNYDADKFAEINRTVTDDEYNSVVDYAQDIGIKNAYVQSGKAASESFVPMFDYEGV